MYFFFSADVLAATKPKPTPEILLPTGGQVYSVNNNLRVVVFSYPPAKKILVELSTNGRNGQFTQIGEILENKKKPYVDHTVLLSEISQHCVVRVSYGGTSVVSPEFVIGPIPSESIGDGTVTTPKVADSAITTVKISDNAVTESKISSGAASSGFLLLADGIGGVAWSVPPFVKKTGDTMTGFLTLSADPIDPLHAATKQIVDAEKLRAIAAETALQTSLAAKADKVAGASNGNFAGLNASGNLIDSGSRASDFLGAAATAADSAKLGGFSANLYALGTYVDGQNAAQDGVIAGKINRSGDAMTGFLTLVGNPVNPLHAAPRQYVDAGDATLTGTKVSKAGDTMTGLLRLSGDPVDDFDAATKQFVDAETSRATAAETLLTNTKVAKAGDTMTGFLTLNANPAVPLHAVTKQYVDSADNNKVDKAASNTISAQHIFNPASVGVPFILGSNAQGQKIAGLNADLLDGNDSTFFATAQALIDETARAIAAETLLMNTKLAKSGDSMTGFLTLHSNPTAALQAAPKQYVDAGDATLTANLNNEISRAIGAELDLDNRKVDKATANTISAQHTFNPASAGVPFILGSNAQGQKVAGLNADLLDGNDSAFFQRRVTGSASAGQFITAINADGSVETASAGSGSFTEGPGIDITGSTISAVFGNSADTVTQGNDARLSDARSPLPGSANYIQNQTASAQPAGFNLSGNGLIAGNIGIGTTAPNGRVEIKNLRVLTGAGTILSAGTTVIGSGTGFMTQLATGDSILAAGQTQIVASITNDIQLSTVAPFNPALSGGTTFTYVKLSDSGNSLNTLNVSTNGTAPAVLVNSSGTAPAAVFATGNVGIGAVNPGSKLTVAGMIETTSAGVKFPDGTVQTTASNVPTVRVYTSNATWTKPAVLKYVVVEVVGGGGGGGTANGSSTTGAGGGGGGYSKKIIPANALGATETVIVGAGGPTDQGNGSASSFGAHLSATGGGGGGGFNGGSYDGGLGGQGISGDINVGGGGGGGGGGSTEAAGAGGSSVLGGGGHGRMTVGTTAGRQYGGGGAGGKQAAGFPGAAGVVIVTEY